MDIINFLLNALSSLGTIVALVALTYQIMTEKRAKDEEQANNISTWLENERSSGNDHGLAYVIISNQSNHPIYEVVFSIDDLYAGNKEIGTEYNCSCINVLPPGKYMINTYFRSAGMCHKFNSSITFRDHCGRYWTRNATGVLIREKGENVIYNKRKISQPYSDVEYDKISD